MLKIGEFSKLSRVSIRMLRHYDEIGLLKPVCIDSDSGYRYYSENQLPMIARIVALKNMGFALSVIARLLEHYEDKMVLEQYLLLKKLRFWRNINYLHSGCGFWIQPSNG